MAIQMAASHAVGRKLVDPIFEANAACKEAIKKFGADKVDSRVMTRSLPRLSTAFTTNFSAIK